MPVKTFTSLDVINFVSAYTAGPTGLVTPTVAGPDFGTLSISGSGSNGFPGTESIFTYHQTADLDYDAPLAIPDNVLISRMVVRLTQAININAAGNNIFNTNDGFVDVTLVTLSDSFSQSNGPPFNHTKIDSTGPILSDTTFSPPISKADLIAGYSSFLLAANADIEAGGASIGTYTISFDMELSNWSVEITYESSLEWDLEVPDDPATGIPPATIVTVTANSDDPTDTNKLDVSQILTIELDYTDDLGNPQVLSVPNFTVFHRLTLTRIINILRFTIPDLTSIGTPPGAVIISITSTQFSGSVILGRLITIYFVNAPGIYTLVPNKHTDTLYDIENGDTVEVKIPDPFIKTGFVGN